MTSLRRSLVVLLLMTPALTYADDEPKAEAKAKSWSGVDAKTEEVLKKVGGLYKNAKSLHADVAVETAYESPKREVKLKGVVDMQRPNHFALRTKSDKEEAAGMDVVCDGKNLFVHHRPRKQYTESKAPDALMPVGQSYLAFAYIDTGMLFQNVLANEPDEALLEGVFKGEYAGLEKLDGKDAHHLKFRQPGLDWELWVAAEGDPVVMKAVSKGSIGRVGKVTTTESYSNWKLDAPPAKDAFDFKPPEGSKKVPAFPRPGAGSDR